MANFIKLFWHNLHLHLFIASSIDAGYAAKGVNYAEEGFMKLTPGFSVRFSSSLVSDGVVQ